MIPLHFGSADRRLFGLYSPAEGDRRRHGVVICQPVGDEYQRAHRTCRILAQRLARQGCDVLRFDYFGTGDSSGDDREFTVAGAVDDAESAVEELRDLARVNRLTLVGLRLGGLIAAEAAQRSRARSLVLWDPIGDLDTFVQSLRESGSPLPSGDGADLEVAGFCFSSAFQHELLDGDPWRAVEPPKRTLLIVSDETDGTRSLRTTMDRSRGAPMDYQFVAAPPAWTERRNMGVGAVPAEALSEIVGWCA